MNGKVHVAIGTASLALLCLKFPEGFEFAGTHITPIIGMFAASAGSYAPDIDLARSHAGQKHKGAASAVKVAGKVTGVSGHRGITHTLLVPALLIAVMVFTNVYFARWRSLQGVLFSLVFGFLYGYVVHIAADLFNGKGCPIFWPITKNKVHVMDLPSTGVVPWIFAVFVVGLQLVLFIGVEKVLAFFQIVKGLFMR